MVTGLRTWLGLVVIVVFAGGEARAEGWRAYLSPGPVAKGHQNIAGKCDRCHLVFKGLPDEKCLVCHTGIQERLDAGAGFHAKVRAQPCIACHDDHKGAGHSMTKEAATDLFDHELTSFALQGRHADLACEKCHNKPLERLRNTCVGCHEDHHEGGFGARCQDCHGSVSWTAGVKTRAEHRVRMDGGHTGLDCESCHAGGQNLREDVPCASCHERAHGGTEEPCEGCHSVSGFKPAKFDHSLCPCAFPGKHKTASCLSCHEGFRFTNTPTLCSGCHTKDLTHDPLGECSVCHSPLSWTKNLFDHNKQAKFTLRNRHLEVDCFRCHIQTRKGRRLFKAAPRACYGCHKQQGIDAHGDFGNCAQCHTTRGFDQNTFDHAKTGFALDGRHGGLKCQDCHAKKVEGYPKTTSVHKRRRRPRQEGSQREEPKPVWPRPVTETLLAMLIAMPSPGDDPRPAPAAAPRRAIEDNDQRACAHCHDNPHQGTAEERCTGCHTTATWRPSTFGLDRHALTAFPLHGAHTKTACTLCHVGSQLRGQPKVCAGCHMDVHEGRFGAKCAECHDETAFAPAPGFDHARTGFALTGPHAALGCLKCHGGQSNEDLTKRKPSGECKTCHALGHGPELGDDCQRCHPLTDKHFSDADRDRFDHSKTPFALERRHRVLECKQCHPAPVKGRPSIAPTGRCMTCHLDPHKGNNSNDCALCHEPDRWRLVRFDHDQAGWPLRGRHFVTPCAACHTNQRWFGLTTDCFDCHALDAMRGASVRPGAHPFGRLECRDCHFSGWTWQL